MFTHTHVQAHTVDYTLDDIIKYTTNLVKPTRYAMKAVFNKVKHVACCRQFVSDFVKANRWEMFNTFEGYKIILNGYGEFKHIVMDSGKVYKAQEIFNKMRFISV